MNEFDKVGLYEHNAESYRKVREAFKENNVVGIVHATGTGKSYNALQLAYDNKDIKTVWVVPSNSIVEHILKTINDNPNLDMERDFPNLELRTYQSFINSNSEEIADLDVDMLILDEFHHTGAPVWGSRIDSIIETHPDIKVFGMTAYTVRDRGTSYERDMALDEGDELFSDNIVSRYDLCDAMIDGVLPKPVYKSSYIKLIDMASQLEERVKKLEASGRECSEYNKILSDVKKRIHEAPSLGETVKQNIKKNGKYIYFCPPAGEEGTNDIESIKKEAMSWFKEIVPEEDIVIYTSLSEMEDGGKSNRDAFYDDLDLEGNKVDNKLRVMFAINQYNEGVHAPNLDGVIMGRGTCSDIVFFEQLGRALSVSSGVKEKIELYNTYSMERLRLMCSQKNINYNYDMNKEELIEKLVAPVIIDLAGNIDFIRELEDNLKDRIKEYQEKGNGTLTRRFLSDASFDLDTYEVELFNILMDLKPKTEMTWDDWYKLAEEYYKEHGNLKVSQEFKTSNGEKLGKWINTQRIAYKYRTLPIEQRKRRNRPLTDEQVKKLESIGMMWFVFDENWNRMFELAQEYYKKHGNLEVPISYVTTDGEKLGAWVRNQRTAYKNRYLSLGNRQGTYAPLTDEQVAKMESIGMIWDTYKEQWEKMFGLAQEYYKKHGNLEVPKRYITPSGERLGVWVQIQRMAYRNRSLFKEERKNNFAPLTDERVSRLESIGMIWNTLDTQWERMFELAKEYYEKYGDLKVTGSYTAPNGEKLGQWINNQRNAYRNRALPKNEIKSGQVVLNDDRLKKLESIGMIWDPYKEQWEKMFKLALKYYEKYGDLRVPFSYVSPNGERLGTWIASQRKAYKNRNLFKEERKDNFSPLTDEQVGKLESIGMIWDLKENDWMHMYNLADTYYKEHGNLKVPQGFITSNGEQLGVWISNQRKMYRNRNNPNEQSKNGKVPLTDEQVTMLESIGILWNPIDEQWDRMFELAKAYYEEHGDLKIPARYITPYGENLGTWICTQRKAYAMRNNEGEKRSHQASPLIDEQVQKLESIGMIWDPYKEQWEKMFEIAQEYYEEHGNLKVPDKYNSPDGESLGTWIATQRRAYKIQDLTEEEIKRLESIGMIWDVFDLQWQKMFGLAQEYYEEHGNLKVPKGYITPSGERLASWLGKQRLAYKNISLPIEQRYSGSKPLSVEKVAMLESIGMIWDAKKNKSDIEDLCKDNNIDVKKNKNIINHISFTEFKVKLTYLKDNGINIIDENGILHEIFSMSSMNMKLKYGVSLEDLVNMYGKEKNK